MQSTQENLIFHADWYNRTVTGNEYIDWVSGCLRELAAVNKKLSSLYLPSREEAEKSVFILPDHENLASAIIAHLDRNRAYVRASGNSMAPSSNKKEFTLDSICPLGFDSWFYSTLEGEAPGIMISMSMGGTLPNFSNDLHFEISEDSEFVHDAKQLFISMVNYAKPDHAMLWRRSVPPFPKSPAKDRAIGWLTYFQDKSVGEFIPPEFHTEDLASGVLVQTSDLPPFPNDKEGAESMLRLFNVLSPHGVLLRLSQLST